MFDLTGKVALVTGGNSGIGLAYAKGLLKSGAKVAIWGRNPAKNQVALEALSDLGEAVAVQCDVTDESDVGRAFEETLSLMGQVDICFANAGGSGARGPLHTIGMSDWQATVDLNLNSVVQTYKAVIEHLIERKAPGKLIVTSSIAAHMGIGMAAGYCATKAAVSGLTRSLAVELGPHGIQVNAVLPGFIATEMSLQTPQHFQDSAKRRTSSGVLGTLEDMEGLAVFLASNSSNYITGQEIVIDGGQLIYPM